MSKTLHNFGAVLFEELEQVAVRRGRFASLIRVHEELVEARKRVIGMGEGAVNPIITVPLLRQGAERWVMRAGEALAIAADAADAIERLAQVVSARCETSLRVVDKMRKPDTTPEPPVAFKSVVTLLRAFQSWVEPKKHVDNWEHRRKVVGARLHKHAHILRIAQRSLKEANNQVQLDDFGTAKARLTRLCRMASGLQDLQDLDDEDREIASEALKEAALQPFHDREIEERLIRAALIRWTRDATAMLAKAATEIDQVIAAYRQIAETGRGITIQIERLIEVQSDASRYEIGDIIEDGARAAALRLGTVGLAFSGGGIRSATFNLGFLQGIASFGLLKQFDYLSTVSGGGYIGGWFAAWVRREGGRAGEPIRPGEADVARVAAPRILEARQQFRNRPGITPEEVTAAEARIKQEVEAELQARYQAEVEAKRRRTSRALENVEKQLHSSRAVQGKAERRWATSREILEGREDINSPPPPFRQIVEEEPEPVYHLRAFSNYLAPKVGLLSVDTWTMVSVYLRNLMLNQFILLPMMLAAVFVPRLMLILYAHLNTQGSAQGSATAIAARWLEHHPGWLPIGMIATVFLASITVPKLIDHLAQRIGRWAEEHLQEPTIGRAILFMIAIGLFSPVLAFANYSLAGLAHVGFLAGLKDLAARLPFVAWSTALVMLIPLALILASRSRRGLAFARKLARGVDDRVKGWSILLLLPIALASLVSWLPALLLSVFEPWTTWLTGDMLIFFATFVAAVIGFHRTYQTVILIREVRQPVSASQPDAGKRFDLPHPILWEQILLPMTFVAIGVSLLYARPGKPYFDCPLPWVGALFRPETWGDAPFMAPVCFGALVGLMRLIAFLTLDFRIQSHEWKAFEKAGRATSALASGLVAGTALAASLSWLHQQMAPHPGGLAAATMSFGPLMVLIAIGIGSAIEVGLIGDYGEEDMREWRASLGAYLLMIGTFWTAFSVLSVYGPMAIWEASSWWPKVSAAVIWVVTSVLGAMAGRSSKTDGSKRSRSPLEYVALVAPPVFVIGLVVVVSMLATVLQGQNLVPDGKQYLAGIPFLNRLANVDVGRTWAALLASAWVATIGCVYVNINLFALNAFYANRLVRCYLGASRPRESSAGGQNCFAPTNSPVPVRRPNPITGFDPTDDFPMRDLAVVRDWGDDLIVDYRGPYHLVNTSMNLVAGSELAWQERMAEAFVITPLHCGSKNTGYRRTIVKRGDLEPGELEPEERGLPDDEVVPGYGGDVRLGTAVSVSGAAASPNAGYHSSPLVTILMTVLNARLGLWFGNPSRDSWRKSGPGFALYLFDELFGRTTSKGKYVYLSDGGHFENLGVYELIRRRCRHIVVCDAGADPNSSFWDLGGLVRKCREDFGVRIEIDNSPLIKKEGSCHSKWHCSVGKIHYEDVDSGANPGTLFYVKPTLTGDEPSDVRNYVVDHPSFPHESTADQFFSESQFESYRVLGEHIAIDIFRDAVRDAGPNPKPNRLFSKLHRRWFPPPPDIDKNFLNSVKPFVEIHQALRSEPELERLAGEIYPEIARRRSRGAPQAPAPPSPDELAEVCAVIQMLHVMENAWMAVSLEAYSDHPLNRGWMNVFRRWTNSNILQACWPAVRGEFSEGFVRFCESELNLTVHNPGIIWLDSPIKRGPRTWQLPRFRKALKDLDREFSLEWPRLILPEIGERPAGLVDMFDYAHPRPPRLGGPPLAGIIVPGDPSRHHGASTAEPPYYGIILAWTSSHGMIDMTIWLRGAYRTLGIGRKVLEGTLKELTREFGTNGAGGFTVRTRYPTDKRGLGKQRWQGAVWTEFFRNQGFHHAESNLPDDELTSFIFRHESI